MSSLNQILYEILYPESGRVSIVNRRNKSFYQITNKEFNIMVYLMKVESDKCLITFSNLNKWDIISQHNSPSIRVPINTLYPILEMILIKLNQTLAIHPYYFKESDAPWNHHQLDIENKKIDKRNEERFEAFRQILKKENLNNSFSVQIKKNEGKIDTIYLKDNQDNSLHTMNFQHFSTPIKIKNIVTVLPIILSLKNTITCQYEDIGYELPILTHQLSQYTLIPYEWYINSNEEKLNTGYEVDDITDNIFEGLNEVQKMFKNNVHFSALLFYLILNEDIDSKASLSQHKL